MLLVENIFQNILEKQKEKLFRSFKARSEILELTSPAVPFSPPISQNNTVH